MRCTAPGNICRVTALYEHCKKYFDLLHKTSLSVPMYADRLVLFVFAPLLTSERCELLVFPALPVSGHRYADRLVLFVFAPLLTSEWCDRAHFALCIVH